MFDKLIESNSVEAEFKPRRKFFMVSSVVVGIAFLSAVVFSLYAQDINLGVDNFELVEMLAPVETDAPQPEPPRQQPQQQDQQQRSDLPSRQTLTARIDQPQAVPDTISTTPNKYLSIPKGNFNFDPNAAESNGSGVPVAQGGNGDGSSSATVEPADSEVVRNTEPPPPAIEKKKPVVMTKGVVNGTAVSLPKPPYPQTARAMNITGDVSVQVLIDEQGNVVSAKAVSGHIFLKPEAERAAWKAKFRPTYLSEVPVKVTGVIVYRFSK